MATGDVTQVGRISISMIRGEDVLDIGWLRSNSDTHTLGREDNHPAQFAERFHKEITGSRLE